MTRSKSFRCTALCGALSLALYAPLAVQAQETPAQDPNQAAQAKKDQTAKDTKKDLDKVVVTGSRIKRAEIEGPAPVTVLTGEEMRKQGYATVFEAMRNLTEAIGPVANDYDWGQSAVNGKPLNLRGLGPGRSLLLINGHRVADYPMPYQGKSNFANYNNIPTGIVERIEVLSGSASAIYGSDAMAGVVNVILKKDVDGHTVRAKWGHAARGGYINKDFEALGGFSGKKWHLTYDLQHFDRGTLLAKDRPFMDSEDDKAYDTWNEAERHFNRAAIQAYPGLYLRDRDKVVPLGPGSSATYRIAPPPGACEQFGSLYYRADLQGYDRATGTEYDAGQYCAQRVFGNWALKTGSKSDSVYLHGTYDFNDNLEGWASLGIWQTTGGFNTFLDGFSSPNYWDPRANNGQGGTRQFLKFQSPQELGGEKNVMTRSRERSIDFSAGLRGRMLDRFDWEAMLGRATYTDKESFPTLNQGMMAAYYLGPQQGTHGSLPVYTPDYNKLWNPVPASDTAAFSKRGENGARSWLNQAQFLVTGDLFKGWAGPIGFAGVLDYGKQGYSLTPDPKVLNSDNDPDGWYTPFGNVMQGGGSRSHYGAGVEFKVPVLKTLTVDLAGRYDKYQAVRNGAKPTYQIGIEWRPLSTLLLRGTYATSFRAPDMHYIYAKPSSAISDFTDYTHCAQAGWPNRQCPREDFLINDAVVARSGTTDLKYETGKSYSYGFVWDAFKNFSVSADYWDVKIANMIDDIDGNQLLLDDAYCTQNGFTPDGRPRNSAPSAAWCSEVHSRIIRDSSGNVTALNVNPINRADTHVRGIDMNVRYRLPKTAIGNFTFSANWTNLLTYESRQFPTDAMTNTRTTTAPTYKFVASMDWNYNRWNANLNMTQKAGGRNNRWGDCTAFADGYRPSPQQNCTDTTPNVATTGQSTSYVWDHRHARRYFNGSLGYQVTDSLKINVYANNILNKIYGDKWCSDFAYCVDDPVGRQLAAEAVYHF